MQRSIVCMCRCNELIKKKKKKKKKALNIQERKYKYDVQSVFHEDFYFSVYEPLNLPLISINFGRFGASKRNKS